MVTLQRPTTGIPRTTACLVHKHCHWGPTGLESLFTHQSIDRKERAGRFDTVTFEWMRRSIISPSLFWLASQPPHLHLLSSVLLPPSLSLSVWDRGGGRRGGRGRRRRWRSGGLNKGFIERRDGRKNGWMTFWTMSVTAVMCELVSCWVSS